MLVSIRTDHPQYREIMLDGFFGPKRAPKPVIPDAFTDDIAALKAHMQSHQLTRTGWVFKQ